MHSLWVGGDDAPELAGTDEDCEPLLNQLYRDNGFNVPYGFWNGATAPHEAGHLFNLMHTWGPTAYNNDTWGGDPNFIRCGNDPRCPDLRLNDGPYLWAPDEDRPDWSGPPQNLFVPFPGRQACTGFGDVVDEGAVPYSNVMNYGPDDEALTFTADQRLSVRNTLELFDTFKPMIARPAPLDCNQNADHILNFVSTQNSNAVRAYVGTQMVWQKDPPVNEGRPPTPLPPQFPASVTNAWAFDQETVSNQKDRLQPTVGDIALDGQITNHYPKYTRDTQGQGEAYSPQWFVRYPSSDVSPSSSSNFNCLRFNATRPDVDSSFFSTIKAASGWCRMLGDTLTTDDQYYIFATDQINAARTLFTLRIKSLPAAQGFADVYGVASMQDTNQGGAAGEMIEQASGIDQTPITINTNEWWWWYVSGNGNLWDFGIKSNTTGETSTLLSNIDLGCSFQSCFQTNWMGTNFHGSSLTNGNVANGQGFLSGNICLDSIAFHDNTFDPTI